MYGGTALEAACHAVARPPCPECLECPVWSPAEAMWSALRDVDDMYNFMQASMILMVTGAVGAAVGRFDLKMFAREYKCRTCRDAAHRGKCECIALRQELAHFLAHAK